MVTAPQDRPPYDRTRDLPALIPVWPSEVIETASATIVARLRRALVQERQRGLGGHWSYDLARHARLLAAYRMEVALLRTGKRTSATSKAHAAAAGSRRARSGDAERCQLTSGRNLVREG